MVYSFDYDLSYSPAMPVVEVEIRYAEDVLEVSFKAIVDSGADGTIIPIRYLQQVKARKGDKAQLRGIAQQRLMVDKYWVWLRIGSHRSMYVQVVSDRGDEAILGRDILNQWIVTLNGLASVVEIAD